MFRRRYPRVKAIQLIATEPISEEILAEHANLGATLNLSTGGALFESRIPYPLLATLKISLALGEEIIEVQGRVVRIEEVIPKKFRVAVHFVNMTEEIQEKIQQFVEGKADITWKKWGKGCF